MATHRGPVRRTNGLRFGKLLGTTHDRTFSLRDVDVRQYGLLATWRSERDAAEFEESQVVRSWRRVASEQWRLRLTPLSSRGRWSGRAPFGVPKPARWKGKVVALTRSRLVPAKVPKFWRAIPPVAADIAGRDGLLAALGVSEIPVGVQGTISVWRNADDLTAFAYRGAPHQAVMARKDREGWYAEEELFARFGVLDSVGTFRGADPVT
ncbi:monooxygenase [Fodinicola feengrottensis]|uniref:monooxygenase n=1 Tax=Fodinicola feengrottensis TaxID=435914 RepID=UPI00244204DB|nr:monooxygenase [Fodinicola feengrottensis]